VVESGVVDSLEAGWFYKLGSHRDGRAFHRRVLSRPFPCCRRPSWTEPMRALAHTSGTKTVSLLAQLPKWASR
jgi:hypothetical protein